MPDFKFNISPAARNVIEEMTDTYRVAGKYRFSDPEKRSRIIRTFLTKEITRRTRLLDVVNKERDKHGLVKNLLKAHSIREMGVDVMVNHAWTFDPRNTDAKLPTSLPFIPWQKQIEYMEWVYTRFFDPMSRDNCIVKARDQGGSFLFLWISLMEWRFNEGHNTGLGSEKVDKVDKKGDINSLFEKLRFMLRMMPEWWLPKGFNWAKHDNFLNLINPENANTITGEGGEQIGRGGRVAWYLLDEYAAIPKQDAVDAALSRTTNSQFNLSTPRGTNNFYKKVNSGRSKVFIFDWWDDPRVDKEWYDHYKSGIDPVIAAQEVDHDFHASVEGLFINPRHVDAAVKIDLPPAGERAAGLDVAAGGKNKTALVLRTGPVFRSFPNNMENAIYMTNWVIEMCNKAGTEYLNYDEIGVGFAPKSYLEAISETQGENEIKFMYYGVNAGSRASNRKYPEFRNKYGYEVFQDAKSEWWYLTSERFRKTYEHFHDIKKYPIDELISIHPDDTELRAQLCTPLKLYTPTGKIKVESKISMKTRGIESPDEADACVMCSIPQDAGNRHVVGYKPISVLVKYDVDFEGKPGGEGILHYGAISVGLDFTVSCLCAVYYQARGDLYIYDEHYSETISHHSVCPELVEKMHLKKIWLDKMLGNAIMMSKDKRNLKREYNNYFYDTCGKYQTVTIREPRKYEPMGAANVLQDLAKANKIHANPECENLKEALRGWRVEKGKFNPTGFREALLMIVSELVQVVPIEKILKLIEYKKV